MPVDLDTAELIDLFNAGQYAQLEPRLRLLTGRYPESGFAWKILGATLQALGKDSLSALRKAAELLPEDPEAHNNLGVALKDLGQVADAVANFRHALEIAPDFAMAYNNLGNALLALGQATQAIASCRRAIELMPDYAGAHSNLGNALQAVGRLPDAIVSFRRAVELDPGFANAHSNLGVALRALGQFDGAIASLRRALEIDPKSFAAHNNLGTALYDLGEADGAIASFRRAMEFKPDYPEAHSNIVLTMNSLQSLPMTALLAEARRYGTLVARNARPFTEWPNTPDPSRPLKIGLVSGDLCMHPVGFLLDNVVARLPHERMRLFVYETDTKSDHVTERLKGRMQKWTTVVGLSDEATARQVRADGIDILVDLAGHTARNRLPVFAWKPAPVQVAWLGYWATTGVPGMDYILVDPWSVPPGEENQFTEEVWRLPQTRLCFTPPEVAEDVGPLPALACRHVTFGCFNSLAKVNDAVIGAWARVLEAVPDSRLFLKARQIGDSRVHRSLHARLVNRGIAEDRLILEGSPSRPDYFAAHNRVDIGLDTFPYTGGATTIDALWMGVPVLTLKGDRLLSRQGEGLLANAGLQDWIATGVDDYVARAARYAGDLDALAKLRACLRSRVEASPLFDARLFAGHLEAALRAIWQRWCDNRVTDDTKWKKS